MARVRVGHAYFKYRGHCLCSADLAQFMATEAKEGLTPVCKVWSNSTPNLTYANLFIVFPIY